MPRKPNYGFEKRMKEMERKKKKEEKQQRRREQREAPVDALPDESAEPPAERQPGEPTE